ncbi:MAG: pre-16S rRNA-processing nuclease YqgF [Quinella sp. 3Q1]|nr:pre-16S rRNA-processing nuclease YqgF [Quinella sp. 3Q1]MBR6888779.1 pre-16S rRNA-processing nuclease YqgF [Selenomonadaceae bacterium]
MYMGIDPGRDKCGVAVLTAAGEIKFQRVVVTEELDAVIKNLAAEFEIQSVILGDGTTHKAAAKKVSAAGLTFQLVDEKHTTEEARRLYWKKNPPQGWRKFLPTSMQVPPEPVDAIVAEILVRRFLQVQNKKN